MRQMQPDQTTFYRAAMQVCFKVLICNIDIFRPCSTLERRSTNEQKLSPK
jgi:hypothetical protein